MTDGDKRWPPWLVGLLIAIVVSIGALVVLNALGFGDDPAIDSLIDLTRQL